MQLPREVERSLGWYVYLYVDPRNGRVFYVGKGKHGRVLAHLGEAGEKRKHKTIREIQEAGLEPLLEVLSHGLPDEETAFRVEAAAIDLLGLTDLCNEVRGWQSIQFGRMGLKELVGYYAAVAVEVTDPAVLIRISQLYRHNRPPPRLVRGDARVLENEFAQSTCSLRLGRLRSCRTVDEPEHLGLGTLTRGDSTMGQRSAVLGRGGYPHSSRTSGPVPPVASPEVPR